MNKIIQGDCLEVLRTLPDESVDSIVTDPPYELGFMGKKWDNTGIAYNVELWKECLRVLKPGGHLLAFSGTRTYHRMAVAIEDAGFEVRDMIEWVYGSGMSKCNVWGKGKVRTSESLNAENDLMVENGWEGWGKGGLKPAHEPIAFCRKPIEKGLTVAENCLKWGTGGINIDESRVDVADSEKVKQEGHIRKGNVVGDNRTSVAAGQFGDGAFVAGTDLTNGRFPANLIHDNSEEVRECFPETKSGGGDRNGKQQGEFLNGVGDTGIERPFEANSGNASRFFKSIIYQAKASKSERNRGCDKNNHPTVKPIALMEYLIKMITPKGGIVLDPFMGSGTTGVACKNLNRNFIGIELDKDYFKIAKKRISSVPDSLFGRIVQ